MLLCLGMCVSVCVCVCVWVCLSQSKPGSQVLVFYHADKTVHERYQLALHLDSTGKCIVRVTMNFLVYHEIFPFSFVTKYC